MTRSRILTTPTRAHRPALWEKITTVVVAVLVVGLVGWLVIRNRTLDPNLFVLTRIIISLAVAVLGATIPGFLNVGWTGQGIAIRAGGALALFLITFFWTPEVITSDRGEDEVDYSLRHFSIERPESNQELPLWQDQSGPLLGKLPIDRIKDEATREKAQVTIRVFKSHERQEIPQEVSLVRPSRTNGLWYFVNINFAGEGDYEIFATASLADKHQDLPPLKVKCTEKAKVTLLDIERWREARGATKLVVPSRESVTQAQLGRIKANIYRLQEPMLDDIERADYNGALEVFRQAMDLIDPVLALFPDDLDLQVYRAYFFKNYAMVKDKKRQNEPNEFDKALKGAEKIFAAIIAQDPNDARVKAGAWNGLGNILLLREEPEKALPYIDGALKILPDYEAAMNDRQIALDMMKQQKMPSRE